MSLLCPVSAVRSFISLSRVHTFQRGLASQIPYSSHDDEDGDPSADYGDVWDEDEQDDEGER